VPKVSDIEFVSSQIIPHWNCRAQMAKKIRDFLNIPTRCSPQPRFQYASAADKILAKYRDEVQALRAHVNARTVITLIHLGQLP
jgi:hypothetical protein